MSTSDSDRTGVRVANVKFSTAAKYNRADAEFLIFVTEHQADIAAAEKAIARDELIAVLVGLPRELKKLAHSLTTGGRRSYQEAVVDRLFRATPYVAYVKILASSSGLLKKQRENIQRVYNVFKSVTELEQLLQEERNHE